jgi:hypothetical protein
MTGSPEVVTQIYRLLYVGVLSGVLVLVVVRAVVADVQPAVEPFACCPKMLLHEPGGTANVRAVVATSALAMPATPLMELVEYLA